MGFRRRLGRLQLWTIQLAHMRVRAEAKRVAVAFARIERPAEFDAAAGSHEPAATHAQTLEEALSKTGIRP
jgi:hypothetical protein